MLVYPMEDLPYMRVAMERLAARPRWERFAEASSEAIETVYQTIQERGPLSSRDFTGSPAHVSRWRSGKDNSLALYYLWLKGGLMTHSRRNFTRLHDLRERIVPPTLDYVASPGDAEGYLALRVFRQLGIVPEKNWKNHLSGAFGRSILPSEAAGRIQALQEAGTIVSVAVEGDPKGIGYVLAEDLPLLDSLQSGRTPTEWEPLGTTTEEEAVFLAPLEITTARGRALPLFGFDYVWEVYKPLEQRRWGYYTLPILVGDRLVGRADLRTNRTANSLEVKGFWLEQEAVLDAALEHALAAGFTRFMGFIGAERLDAGNFLPDRVIRQVSQP